MAYESQIAAIESAMSKGILTVRHGDTSVTYANFKDMLEALKYFKTQATQSSDLPIAGFASFSDGGA